MSDLKPAPYHLRYRRGCTVLNYWLPTLPETGWAGNGSELVEALEQFAYPDEPEYRHDREIPTNIAKVLRNNPRILKEAGWRVSFSRSARERLIAITRTKREQP
jgi:hypothetical protein